MWKHTVVSSFPPACLHCRKVFGCNGASTAKAELGVVELVAPLLQKKPNLILSSCCASLWNRMFPLLLVYIPIILAVWKCGWSWAIALPLDGRNGERERKSESDRSGRPVNLELKVKKKWNRPVWCIGNQFFDSPHTNFLWLLKEMLL